jgi:hypothetical protein
MTITMQRQTLHQMIDQLPEARLLDLTRLLELWQSTALAVEVVPDLTLDELVAQIQHGPKAMAGIIAATVPLDEVLTYQADATFDAQAWDEQWQAIEVQLDLAEELHAQARQGEIWPDIC